MDYHKDSLIVNELPVNKPARVDMSVQCDATDKVDHG